MHDIAGLPGPLRFFLTGSWAPYYAALILIGGWLVARLIEWAPLNLKHQYFGAKVAYPAVSLGSGLAVYAYQHYDIQLFQANWWLGAAAPAIAVVASSAMWGMEIFNSIKSPSSRASYQLPQHRSASKIQWWIGTNILLYLIATVWFGVAFGSGTPLWVHDVILLLFLVAIGAIIADNFFGRPDLLKVHPPQIFGRPYRKHQPDDLSAKLGILPGFRWMVNSGRKSAWGLGSMALLLMLGTAVVAQARIPNPLVQYKGAFPGDLWLGVFIGMCVHYATYRLRFHPFNDPEVPPRWFQKVWWRIVSLGVAIAFATSAAYGEYDNAVRRHTPDAAYTLLQWGSSTNMVHYLIVFVWTYILLAVCVPVFFSATIGRLRRYVLGGLFLLYVGMIALDNFVLPRPNLANVHPLDGGWFTWVPKALDAVQHWF